MKDLTRLPSLALKVAGPLTRDCERPWEAESTFCSPRPRLSPQGNGRLSRTNTRTRIPPESLKDPEGGFFPEPPREATKANTLTPGLWL